MSNFECLLYFLSLKGMRWHFLSHFYNEVIKVEFDYFFLFIVFQWLLFSLVTSRWLYAAPWIDGPWFGATKYMRLIHFCPGQWGNLELCHSVPQVRRVADEGFPTPQPPLPSLPSVYGFLGPQVVCECVWRGAVHWSGQMWSLGHMGSTPSGWSVGSWLATVIYRSSPGGEERKVSKAAPTRV